MDEFPVKMRIQDPMNGVMEQAVAHARFMDVARFGIVYLESFITSVPVCFIRKFAVKREDVVHEMHLEFGDVFPFPFST